MFFRKYWIPLSVFIIAIVGVSLYVLQTRPPKEPIVIYKPVEPLPKSEVKAPEGDTSQGGHFHEDGTWHEGPHVTEAPQNSERVNLAESGENPHATSSAMTPSSKERYRSSGPTMADVVADDLPSQEALRAMSDDALMTLYEDGTENADAIESEMWESVFAWDKVIRDITSESKSLAESQRILAEHSDTVKPLREKMDAFRYEYHVHRLTARRALNEVSRRTHESIAKFPPGSIQILLDNGLVEEKP